MRTGDQGANTGSRVLGKEGLGWEPRSAWEAGSTQNSGIWWVPLDASIMAAAQSPHLGSFFLPGNLDPHVLSSRGGGISSESWDVVSAQSVCLPGSRTEPGLET